MKSPAKQCAPIISVTYKCEDCGDVSHSQASLSLHRSVCHSPGKSRDVSDPELTEENVDIMGKSDQIADACNCPKCGEHFLLLRQNSFNCTLCEFQDDDQERFFVHLKEHYEPNSVMTVDPGSVIIEQVIDDSNDLDNRRDPDSGQENRGGGVRLDLDSQDEPDEGDDPEYVPENDDDFDDEDGDKDWEEPRTKKPKVGVSESPPKNSSAQKKLVRSPEGKTLDDKTRTKMGILWQQEKGVPKKLSFVKTPVPPVMSNISRTPLKGDSVQKQAIVGKKPLTPSNYVTVKQEPVSGDEADQGDRAKTTKWVRLQDIKYVGGSGGSPQQSPWQKSSYAEPGPRSGQIPKFDVDAKYAALRVAAPRYRKRSYDAKTAQGDSGPDGTAPADTPGSETNATNKVKGKQPKPPKPPRERKIPVCGVCKRVFSSSQALKTHLLIHTGEKNYSCEHCGKAFTQWSTCQQHIMSIHSDTKKYTCEFCGSCFSRSSGLKVHQRIHTGEILHHCNICGKGFRAKSYLDRHRTLHTGEKRYRCEFCNKLFRTSTDMKRHRNSVHFGLGNISLTQAREILQAKVDGYIRTPTQRPSRTIIQRFVEDDSSSGDDAEEVIRATTVIAGEHYEL